MVYGFAKQSNGAFRLDSELGVGTTAELWLPRAPKAAASPVAEPVVTKRRPLRPLRVLLVDDHPEVRSTTAAVLGHGGHDDIEAGNGAHAIELLKEHDCAFDLLITDYAMPHLSGTDFLREARGLCPEVPALLITGYAETEMIRDRPAGVELLLKPFTAIALEAAILRSCGASALVS
jgi:CheY-like chemotaxis protein